MHQAFESLQSLLHTLTGDVPILFHLVLGILIAVASISVGKILKIVFSTVGRKIISFTKTELDNKLLDILLERIIAIFTIAGFYFAINEIRRGVSSSDTLFVQVLKYSHYALFVAAVIVATALVIRITKMFVLHALENSRQHYEHMDKTVAPFINRVLSIGIILIAIILSLDHFGQNITSILTLLGAGSLAIGLAAQETISNMISGFVIMLDKPFRIGDRIKIPTGETGDIFEIGLRSTKILDFDNNLIVVPNYELIKSRVINFGYPGGEIRVVVDVGAAYGVDVAAVKSILVSLAQQHPAVLKTPEPEAFLMSFGDSALNFRLACRVHSYQEQFATAESLRIQIYEAFLKKGIDIPFPQRVVHFTKPQGNTETSTKRKTLPRARRRSNG